MAGKYNITIEQGATFSRVITIKSPNGDPMNLNGCALRGQIREAFDASMPSASFVFIFTEPKSTGIVTMLLSAEDTSSLADGRYVYDVEMESSLGTVIRLFGGKVNVTPEVTK